MSFSDVSQKYNRVLSVVPRAVAKLVQNNAFFRVCRGLETGLFTFLAHPDVPINSYLNPDRPFMDAMARIFRLCEERDIPVEINANGQGRRRGYPCREVWELARNYKLRVLVCADAHHVPDLICQSVTQCEDLARELNLNLISLLP